MVISAMGINPYQNIQKSNSNSCVLQGKGISGITKNKSNQFDTLVKTINSSVSKKVSHVNAQSIILSINELSDDEQKFLARDAYHGMQSTLSGIISTTEDRIDLFEDVKNERDYYQSLIEDKSNISECIGRNDVITEKYVMTEDGKYHFANLKAGDYVNIDEIKGHISHLNTGLENLVKMTHANFCAKVNYNSYAKTFSSVFPKISSKYSSLFNPKNNSIVKNEKLTVDNFIEKAKENIESYKQRSESLNEMYKDESLDDIFRNIDPSITKESIQKHFDQIYQVHLQEQLFSCYA